MTSRNWFVLFVLFEYCVIIVQKSTILSEVHQRIGTAVFIFVFIFLIQFKCCICINIPLLLQHLSSFLAHICLTRTSLYYVFTVPSNATTRLKLIPSHICLFEFERKALHLLPSSFPSSSLLLPRFNRLFPKIIYNFSPSDLAPLP